MSESFAAGERVSHPKFGEGIVENYDGKTVSVRFSDGVKKLAAGIAPIKKI